MAILLELKIDLAEKSYPIIIEKGLINSIQYKIKEMYALAPPYPINEYYGYNDEKLLQLTLFVKKAIRLIEGRF